MLTLGVAVSGRWLWPLSRYGPLVDPMRDMQKSWKQIVVFRITYDASKQCIYFTHSAFQAPSRTLRQKRSLWEGQFLYNMIANTAKLAHMMSSRSCKRRTWWAAAPARVTLAIPLVAALSIALVMRKCIFRQATFAHLLHTAIPLWHAIGDVAQY